MQPDAQFLDRGLRTLGEDFDGAVRQIACDAPQGEPPGLEARAVPKIHSLNFPKNEKAANDFVQMRTPQCGSVWGASECCALALEMAADAWCLASIAASRARVNSWACRCDSARTMAAWAA